MNNYKNIAQHQTCLHKNCQGRDSKHMSVNEDPDGSIWGYCYEYSSRIHHKRMVDNGWPAPNYNPTAPTPRAQSATEVKTIDTVAVEKLNKIKESIQEPEESHRRTAPATAATAFEYSSIDDRGISKEIAEYYGVKVAKDDNGNITHHRYAYLDEMGIEQFAKIRYCKDKEFAYEGKAKPLLFGHHTAQQEGKYVIITEGEIDAMTIQQVLYNKHKRMFPVVSLRGAGMTGDATKEHFKMLNKFSDIVLWFDKDDAGIEAANKVAKAFDHGKVRLASGRCKDANEQWMLEKNPRNIESVIYNAPKIKRSSVVGRRQMLDSLINLQTQPSIPFPPCLESLNKMFGGMRLGEIVYFTSGTGSGKSTIAREIAYHTMTRTRGKVGFLALEENPGQTAKKMVGLHMNKNLSYHTLTEEELVDNFVDLFGEIDLEADFADEQQDDDNMLVVDHQGGFTDDSWIDDLREMANRGCKYIFIDHITMLTEMGVNGLSGVAAIDYVTNKLVSFRSEYNVWLGIVAHLSKPDGTPHEEGSMPKITEIRGSVSQKNGADAVLGFTRHNYSDNEEEACTIQARLMKNRFSGDNGSLEDMWFDKETGRVHEKKSYMRDKGIISDDKPVMDISDIFKAQPTPMPPADTPTDPRIGSSIHAKMVSLETLRKKAQD